MTKTLGDSIGDFFSRGEWRKYADLYEQGRREASEGKVLPYTQEASGAPATPGQQGLDRLFEQAGVPDRYRTCSLRSFCDYCELRGIDIEFGKVDALRLARDLIKTGKAKDRPGLLLYGQPGVGKTGILSSVFNALLARGGDGLWIQYNAFIDALQDGYSDNLYLPRLRAAQEAGVVLLDDFGDPSREKLEPETLNRQELMFKLVNTRYNAAAEDQVLLVSSNLRPNGIAAQFGERTAERLFELCAVQEVWGHNLRFDTPKHGG